MLGTKLTCLALLMSWGFLAQAEPATIKHYQQQARYAYGAKLLDLANSKLDTPYEIIAPERQSMNEARGELEVIAGRLDLEWMSTNEARESQMIPIRIPIYQGILGLRLLLVTKEKHPDISKISSIRELRAYTGGHGKHWGDLPVYAANSLKVVTHVKYEKLFELLKIGRFDYFHRGVNEIWGELEAHQNELSIADNLMLFYPHPVYFFVSKHRPELAKQLELGLTRAIADGSFEQLFLATQSQYINQAKLENRSLIVLYNPTLPADTPCFQTNWWLPEKFQPQLKAIWDCR